MLLAILMSLHEVAHELLIEYSPVQGALTQDILVNNGSILAPEPFANRHRESHLGSRKNSLGQYAPHALAQNVLGGPTAQLQSLRQPGGKFDELMIEERYSAFNRSGHAHLVLLHQQFVQIGLDVGVKQPIERRFCVRLCQQTSYARIR